MPLCIPVKGLSGSLKLGGKYSLSPYQLHSNHTTRLELVNEERSNVRESLNIVV